MLHRESPAANGAPSESVRAGQGENTTQLEIVDAIAEAEEGLRRRDDGMRTAELGEDFRIRSAIEADVRRRASTGETFTPDEVLPGLVSRRAIGPVFSRLAREGVIRCVGATTSTRPERRQALTRVWCGTGGRS